MRINIIAPFATDKKIINAILPFARQYSYECYSAQMSANLDPASKGKQADYILKLCARPEWKDNSIFKHSKTIVIGPVPKNTPGISIVYLPDIVSAEEELFERYYFYNRTFVTTEESDYQVRNLTSLVSLLIQLETKKEVKLN